MIIVTCLTCFELKYVYIVDYIILHYLLLIFDGFILFVNCVNNFTIKKKKKKLKTLVQCIVLIDEP